MNRHIQTPLDSLDIQQQQFNRSNLQQPQKNQIIFKNFYRQQLDDLLNKKNKQKQLQKQKNQQQRLQYNQRLRLQQQAQRIKQISYKNYYQMIMSNQQHLKNQYINPFQQRDQLKNKLINKQYEQGKIKNQIQYEKEIRRQENMKKQLQNVLNIQVNQKQYQQKKYQEDKIKQNQNIRQVLLTPHEIQQLERERKLNQMNKYKQDLDKLTQQKMNLSRSKANNPQYLNSPKKLQKHDLLLNPLPYNIQNPYILKQMQKRNMLSSNYNLSSSSNNNNNFMSNSMNQQQQYSPKNNQEGSKKNIFN